MTMNPKPIFIVGAAKSGTSALFSYLGRHPEIFTPEVKELNFFYTDLHAPSRSGNSSIGTLDDYLVMFAGINGEQHAGAASPWYLYSDKAAENIREFAQQPGIIFMLRNAVDMVYEVVGRPSAKKLLALVRWADVVFRNNISLRVAWPLRLVRRPWVVAHPIWVPQGTGVRGLKGALKRALLRRATRIAISDAIAADFSAPCVVIPNPYDDEVFRILPDVDRDRDLVFVGRFVSHKGLPVLLRALGRLAGSDLRPTLTVIGAGPEEHAWRQLAEAMDLSEQVQFAGVKRGAALAESLNAHRVMVVPSLWNEPFGVVALEGMACGCVVIGSLGGGLKQVIGPAGLTFVNGEAAGLAAAIEHALGDPAVQDRCRAAAPAHLDLHRPAAVAKRYLEVFERAA